MTFTLKEVNSKELVLGLLFPVLLSFAITRQSLWMDEGFTVWFASPTSIGSFFSTLLGSRGAPGDPQMVFYLLYMWCWVKLWGASEVALRAANIPFAILLLGATSWASRTLFRRPNVWLILCLSPFMWFYMNEARPYIAVMAFAAVGMVAELAYLLHPASYRVFAPWCCLTALLLGAASHILGVLLIPSLITLFVISSWNRPAFRKTFLRDWSPALLTLLPAFVALGAFFLWTSRFGVNMKRADPGIANLAFVFYEFCGFAGLGPPRNELRENPHVYALVSYWPWLLIGVMAAVAVGYSVLRLTPDKPSRALAISLVAGLSIAFMVAKITHFQLLGRHVAVFFPLVFMLLLSWSPSLAPSKTSRYLSALALTALGIAWGISDLRLVLLPQYQKESYRAASSISLKRATQNGGKILWAADSHTASYYGVRVVKLAPAPESAEIEYSSVTWTVHGQAVDVANWTVEEAADYVNRRDVPLILVLSRVDLYDQHKAWQTLVEEQRPTVVRHMTEFQIYEWPARMQDGIARLRSSNPPSVSSGASQ